jgi:hypothetical protein
MQGEHPSWMRGWHRQNGASGGGKLHKYMRTHGTKGATEPARMGLGRSVWSGRPGPLRGSVRPPFSCTRRFFNPKLLEAPPFARGRAIRLRGRPQARERRGERSFARRIALLEGSTYKWRRRKTPSEASPLSTVLCLAPWWGNLLICPWVVIEIEM